MVYDGSVWSICVGIAWPDVRNLHSATEISRIIESVLLGD